MKSDVEIRKASVADIMEFYGGFRRPEIIEAYGAFLNGKPIGICGLMRDPKHFGSIIEDSGRIIGFLDASPELKSAGIKSVRAMLSFLKTVDHEIYVQSDANNFPQAEKLMRVLGFAPTDEKERDALNHDNMMRVWKWQC